MYPAAKILPILTLGTNLQLFGGMIVLRGWSFVNGDPANSITVTLYDGTGPSGAIVAVIDLLPSESTRDWFSGGGIAVESGLYVDVAGATVVGSIFYSDASLYGGIAFVNGAIEAWTGRL